MATRSRIGLLIQTGHVLSVYHHWDGYPEWLGVTLKAKFNTREKIEELIDGGDMSSCDSNDDWDRKELGETAPLYYNDRGDKTEPRLDTTIEDYLAKGEQYAYLFENDEWVCYDLHGDEPQIVDIPLAVVTKEAVA